MRNADRVLAALLVLTLAATAGAAPKFWWKRDWPYRKLVEIPREQKNADAKAAWVSVATGGHARPDASDLRVVTPRGDILPHAVLGVGPGDRVELAFEPKDDDPVYVYLGNPEPGRPRADWMPDRGLILETRHSAGGNAANLASMRRIIAASKTVFGARRWPRVFDAINPFGPDDDFVSIYRGKILAPRDGAYTFFTASDEASFLLIDGKLVAKWPGRHRAGEGAWAKFKGQITLKKGLHDFEYLHVERTGPQAMAAYWQPPGAKKAGVIPESAFPGLRDAMVVGCEKRGSAVAADFEERVEGKLGFDQRVLTGYRLWARETGEGKSVRYRWDFGDGATGEGPSPRHVYLHGGLFEVRLEAESGGETDVAERVLYVPGAWTYRDRNKPETRDAFHAQMRAYAWKGLDEESVRVGEFLLLAWRDQEGLLRLYREVVHGPNGNVRATHASRMAFALGDLERDVAGDLAAAIRAYRKAGRAGSRPLASSRVRIAQTIVALGKDPQAAVDELRDLLDGSDLWRKDRRLAWIALGDAYAALKKVDEARDAYGEAARYSSEKRLGADRIRAGAASRKASTLMQAEKWLEAIEQIDEWEGLDPTTRLEGFSCVLRAECEVALGRHALARRRLGALLELDPRGNYAARALWLIATSHEAEGDRAKAREAFEYLAENHRDSPLAARAAEEAARLGGELR